MFDSNELYKLHIWIRSDSDILWNINLKASQRLNDAKTAEQIKISLLFESVNDFKMQTKDGELANYRIIVIKYFSILKATIIANSNSLRQISKIIILIRFRNEKKLSDEIRHKLHVTKSLIDSPTKLLIRLLICEIEVNLWTRLPTTERSRY